MANDEIRDTNRITSVEHRRSVDPTGRFRIILGVSFALAVIGLGVFLLSYASRI